jgi:hypothetical protein
MDNVNNLETNSYSSADQSVLTFIVDDSAASIEYGLFDNISIYPNSVIDKLFIQGLSSSSKVIIYNVLEFSII